MLIWGNHELYGSIWSDLLEDEEQQLAPLRSEGLDIRVLHGEATVIAGVRIISATLWTDLKLYPPFEYLARTMVSAYMHDYRAIRTAPKTRFSIDDMLECHARDKAATLSALSEPYSGPTVVMTHHLPVRQLISPARTIGGHEKRAMTNGFACDLWEKIRAFDIHTWIWGHSHEGENWTGEGEKGQIRFITNQRGYPGEVVTFKPEYLVDV